MGNIIGDTQTNVREMYSLWLSTEPVDDDGNPPTDDKFMFLGSSSSLPFQISYSGSTTGILGQTSDTAIFVDGASGAVMNINISTERVNPVIYRGDEDDIPDNKNNWHIGDSYWIERATSSPYTVKLGSSTVARGSLVTYDGSKWVNADAVPNLYSNKKFIEKMMEMRTSIQMMNNAYVLYVYNVSQLPHNISSVVDIENFRKRNSGYYGEGYVDATKPKCLYVYINSFDFSLDMDNPHQIEVSINFIQRNILKGYNE